MYTHKYTHPCIGCPEPPHDWNHLFTQGSHVSFQTAVTWDLGNFLRPLLPCSHCPWLKIKAVWISWKPMTDKNPNIVGGRKWNRKAWKLLLTALVTHKKTLEQLWNCQKSPKTPHSVFPDELLIHRLLLYNGALQKHLPRDTMYFISLSYCFSFFIRYKTGEVIQLFSTNVIRSRMINIVSRCWLCGTPTVYCMS